MTAMSERELKKIQDELAKVIEEQRKENEFRPSLIDALNAASQIINFERRAERLTQAIGVLTMEEIEVPYEAVSLAEDFENDASILNAQLNRKVDNALAEMNQEHLLKFAQMYFNILEVPHFTYIVDHFTEGQKEQVYEILHSEKAKDDYDEQLIWRFEKSIGYSLTFAKEKGLVDTSDQELTPFIEYLDKYVPVYSEKIPASLEWLKTLAQLNLSEKLMMKYSDAAVRRLGIAESPDEEKYMPALEDFKKILEDLMSAKQK